MGPWRETLLIFFTSSIKLSMTLHLFMMASGNYFPHGTPKSLRQPTTVVQRATGGGCNKDDRRSACLKVREDT